MLKKINFLNHLRYLSIFLALVFLSCSKKGHFDLYGPPERGNSFSYPAEVTVHLGESLLIAPESITGGASFLGCRPLGELPLGVQFAQDTCTIFGKPQSVRNYSIRIFADFQGESLGSDLEIKVLAPDVSTLPVPNNEIPLSKDYMAISLADDDHFIAIFSATNIFFVDTHNPYHPNLIKSFSVLMTQSLASTGSFIHAVDDKGNLRSFDWSNREDPILVKTTMLSVSGQHFDMSSDLKKTLFIGNTANNKFLIVDVSDASLPQIVFQDSLAGMGTGGAYANNHAYATDYNGNLYSYKKNEDGTWQRIDLQSTLATAIRPVAFGQFLLTYEYNGNKIDLFSLENPDHPQRLTTFTAQEKIGMYSRPFIRNNRVYITQENPSRVVWLGLNGQNNLEVLGSHIFQPENPLDTPFLGIRGLLNFWNNSFYSVFVKPSSNDNQWVMKSFYFED